jgi:hypothetical protein
VVKYINMFFIMNFFEKIINFCLRVLFIISKFIIRKMDFNKAMFADIL